MPNFNKVGIYTKFHENDLLISSSSLLINSGSIVMPDRPALSVYGSGTTSNLTTTQNGDGTLTTSNFTIEYNHGSHLNGSTGVFTAPIAGLYQANLVARNSGYSSGISQICICKNNSNASGNLAMLEWASSSTMNHVGVSKIYKLAVGDTLRIRVFAGQVNFDGNDSFSVAYIG